MRQDAYIFTESGFLVFKFHEAQLARSNVQLEVLMDDHMFPSYSTPKIRSKAAKLVDGLSPEGESREKRLTSISWRCFRT